MTLDMATFAESLSYADLPPDLLAILRRSFTDTMGVATIGSSTEMSRIARRGAVAVPRLCHVWQLTDQR